MGKRYSYLLSQKQALNERSFKILAVFQGLCVLLCGAMYKIYETAIAQSSSSSQSSRGFIVLCLVLLAAVACFALLSLGAGVASWMRYRNEEIHLEQGSGLPERTRTSWNDAFRWYETYMALAIIVLTVSILAAGLCWILPHVR